jgi:hypothetical protein
MYSRDTSIISSIIRQINILLFPLIRSHLTTAFLLVRLSSTESKLPNLYLNYRFALVTKASNSQTLDIHQRSRHSLQWIVQPVTNPGTGQPPSTTLLCAANPLLTARRTRSITLSKRLFQFVNLMGMANPVLMLMKLASS